jgi:hypothetical protein
MFVLARIIRRGFLDLHRGQEPAYRSVVPVQLAALFLVAPMPWFGCRAEPELYTARYLTMSNYRLIVDHDRS